MTLVVPEWEPVRALRDRLVTATEFRRLICKARAQGTRRCRARWSSEDGATSEDSSRDRRAG
jgi:hypothetical protein